MRAKHVWMISCGIAALFFLSSCALLPEEEVPRSAPILREYEQEAFQYFFRFKGIDFIKENYDVEYTLDYETILEDLGMMCRRNGEKTSMLLKQKKHFLS